MTTRAAGFGLWLALVGTLTLTPDALLMRLSDMDGLQMAAWRGLLMGSVMILGWALSSRARGTDLAQLRTRPGMAIILCQTFNSILFCLGIALAPAMIVLLGVATVPVFAALLAWAFLRETTSALTWITILLVMAGIAYAISDHDGATGVGINPISALGAALGLGVALVLALNFVILRANPGLPIPLAIGCGALMAGLICTVLTGPSAMAQGQIWPMALTGALVLPVSFTLLSVASRHTHAANVSLLMLLETVLGPLWVWMGIGETPSARMLWGGAVVLGVLAIFVILQTRSKPAQNAANS